MHKKRIFKFFRVSISAVLAFSMIFGQIGSSLGISNAQEVQAQETESEYVEETVEASNAAQYGLAENTKQGAILHAWCWSFNTIKENMKDIAEAGFSTVQTSPANTCIVGENGGMELMGSGKWYYHYQPIDWKIGNYQLGSRDDFKAMCEEADKYGVKVIVDVLPNHTSADRGAVTQDLINAAGGMDKLYHKNWDVGCTNWSDRNQITNYKYSTDGCPDVCTENPGFQKYYVEYLNDLITCGVDGFRYDTAKHIGLPDDPIDEVTSSNGWTNNFWPVALGEQSVDGVKLNGSTDTLFIYGEVLQDAGSRDADYGKLFNLTASNYGGKLREAIRNKNFSVNNLSSWENAAGADRLVTWVESHDTYCNNHESGWMTDWDIKMAWAVIAARASGTPLFYSRPDGSNGSQGNYWGNNKIGAKGNDMFKDPEVAAVNFFRNAMAGESEYLRNPNGNSQILQIDRGTKGTCIINLGESTSINNDTTMADGTYTDHVSGREFTVSGGKISGQLDGGKIAVIYTEDKKPQVSASMNDGASFTSDTVNVTFTVKNATSATYSIDGGATASFTDSVELTLGENTAFGSKVSVKITATSAEGTTEKTFIYTKKEAGKVEKNTVYFTKPSGYSGASIYAYIPGDTATNLTGTWPGTAMTDEGDGVYSYTFDASVSECKVIFNDGKAKDGQQTPANVTGQTCGYDYTSGKAYTYSEAEGWVAVEVNTATPTPKPTNTPIPTVTEAPAGIKINSSLADNSSFSTETATIKLTLENAEKGTYCVDDGPVKEFTNSADVVIGKGKIADSTVTVKVTAEADGKTETKTFTYTKEYVATYSNATVNAGADVEEVVEEAEVNAAAETDAYYATNPSGKVGKKATITIDGDCSDWTEDMKVATSAAWDICNNFKGAHEDSVADCYGLYAAWDDENLYLGLEMVNTTDTWGNPGDGPLSNNGKISKVPIGFAIDTGKGNALTGKMETGLDPYIWNCAIEFETRIDYLIYASAIFEGTPGLFRANSEGLTNYTTNCLSFKDEGISYKMADDSVSAQIMEVCNATSPSDVYDSSKYRDALTAGSNGGVRNHDRKYDSFYEINIPLSSLGIDSNYIEQYGIGVMGIGTRGSSGLDCIPHDPTMLDNATGDCAVDPSTSHEKDDTDVITVPLASVGKLRDGTVVPPTSAPIATSTPVPTAEPTNAPIATQVPSDDMAVNFGADRSAPQYNSTALEIKAVVNGGTAPYSYEFFVDNASVKSGTENTYTWQNGSAGAHTIKVVVTDSTGKTATVTKEYDLEQYGDTPINTPIPISTVTPVPTAAVTTAPLPTTGGGNTSSEIQLTKLLVSCITEDGRYKIGDTYVLRAESENAVGTPQYMFTYILNGEEVIVKNYGPETEARFVATEPGKYSFKVYVVDNSNDANPEFETGEINIIDVPGLTITPTPTSNPSITDRPVVTPSVTETPVITAAPTNAPVATQKPAATNATEPSKGSVVNVDKATYKVTETGSSKSVEYVGYKGTKTTVEIPATIKVNGVSYKVTSIAAKAFKGNTKVKVVKIPANVTKIGKEAFSGCTNLTTVKSGTNVASIGDKAFYNCKKLSSITLSKKLTTIGKSAFYKCVKLKKITLNSKVSKIGSKAFYGCKNLKTITIKTKKLTSKNVGSSAFKGINSKAKIKVPSSKMKAYKKLLKSKGAGSKVSYKKA